MQQREEHTIIATTEVGVLRVSTAFLGFRSHVGNQIEQPYETVVLLDGEPGERWQYATRSEAETGHAAIVAWLRGEARPPLS
jgi:hypothetical protein